MQCDKAVRAEGMVVAAVEGVCSLAVQTPRWLSDWSLSSAELH